jgi:hypothetical protein
MIYPFRIDVSFDISGKWKSQISKCGQDYISEHSSETHDFVDSSRISFAPGWQRRSYRCITEIYRRIRFTGIIDNSVIATPQKNTTKRNQR